MYTLVIKYQSWISRRTLLEMTSLSFRHAIAGKVS